MNTMSRTLALFLSASLAYGPIAAMAQAQDGSTQQPARRGIWVRKPAPTTTTTTTGGWDRFVKRTQTNESAPATTEGSSMMMPRPTACTSVFAVPRSIARSSENARLTPVSIAATARLPRPAARPWAIQVCRRYAPALGFPPPGRIRLGRQQDRRSAVTRQPMHAL